MNVEDVVGRCPVSQMLELLTRTWDASSEDVRREFAEVAAAEIRDVLPQRDEP